MWRWKMTDDSQMRCIFQVQEGFLESNLVYDTNVGIKEQELNMEVFSYLHEESALD